MAKIWPKVGKPRQLPSPIRCFLSSNPLENVLILASTFFDPPLGKGVKYRNLNFRNFRMGKNFIGGREDMRRRGGIRLGRRSGFWDYSGILHFPQFFLKRLNLLK